MYFGDLISAEDACDLLDISRPTLMKYVKVMGLSQFKVKKKVNYSKCEILQKLYTLLNPLNSKVDFGIHSAGQLEALKIGIDSYDLRKLGTIDGHGAISLICFLMSEIKKEDKYIHLVIDKSQEFLKAMNFFGALRQHLNSRIFWDEKIFDSIKDLKFPEVIKLPIKRLGVVGSHTKITDDLTLNLFNQGYSQDICAYVGWAIGELTDNASTHAQIHPSFIYFEQFGEDNRFLQFTIGDIGIGIPASLKKNATYGGLENDAALLTAFRPNVSGRPDAEQRGKGLTDVLKIAMECSSNLRVESNNIGLFLRFDSGRDDFFRHRPLYQNDGTIISMMFIDGNFSSLERSDVNNYIDKCLGKL
jgi:hypothetical protein